MPQENPHDAGMSVAIMQPYIFPYLGYFQLLHAVDTFVLLDDVTFIKGGWINRNAILSGGERQRFTIPVLGASPNKEIREVLVSGDLRWRKKVLATLEQAYSKAPFFRTIYSLIEDVLNFTDQSSIAAQAHRGIRVVADFLDIQTEIVESSSIFENKDLGRTQRLIDICRQKKATALLNPEGGQTLYSKDRFKRDGIDLRFLRMRPTTYRQFENHTFVPSLSIIDVLMFNGADGTRALLEEYDLV